MSHTIIGVMGPGGGARPDDLEKAEQLGKQIAKEGWTLLTGGRKSGVMHAASRGAAEAGGLVIGVLPSGDRGGMSEFVDIPICTGMGSARNNINVLTSDVVVACGMGAGTTSEIMLALKSRKPLVLLNAPQKLLEFMEGLSYPMPDIAGSPDEAVDNIRSHL